LVKHDGDEPEPDEQNVPVVPTSASLPSTAVYPRANFVTVPAALASADGPSEACTLEIDDLHADCSSGTTYAQSARYCPDSMSATSPATAACGDPSPGDADAGATTVTPDPSAAAQDGVAPPPPGRRDVRLSLESPRIFGKILGDTRGQTPTMLDDSNVSIAGQPVTFLSRDPAKQ
jgi:hypothetical protein